MSDELKPCPFCGGTDIRTEATILDGAVWCWECDAKIVRTNDANGDHGLAEAIAAWNRRPSPWKPIATAPKDGTRVDLWHRAAQRRLPDCAFIKGRWLDAEGQEWYQPNFTHWYDFGDGKTMPDAPEVG